LGNKVDLVERLLERGILNDETRRITKNRQLGRCCATGSEIPEAPQMVRLQGQREAAQLPAKAD